MSINDEKMFVLKMLEQGKITSEEAAKLIEALDANERKGYENSGDPESSESRTNQNWINENQGSESRGTGNKGNEYQAYDNQTGKSQETGSRAAGSQEPGTGGEDRNDASNGGSYQGYGSNGHRHGQHDRNYQEYHAQFMDEIGKLKEKAKTFKQDFNSTYSKDFDKLVDEFSAKAEKAITGLAKGTFSVADKLNDFVSSFVNTNAFNIFGSYNNLEKTYEADVIQGSGMDVEIEGANGSIVLKKHAEERIVVKSHVKSPGNNIDEIIGVENDQEKFRLKIINRQNVSASHEVFVPAVLFNRIKLETSNGKIYVEDSTSRMLEAKTRNGHVELMGVNSENMEICTKNARVQLSYITGREIAIHTSNAMVDLKHIKAEKLKATTSNARLTLENVQNFENVAELALNLKTSNGSVKVYMNDMDNRGYTVKARTTNGGANLLIPDMIYRNPGMRNEGEAFIEAASDKLDSFAQKVHIDAETTNGHIEIVK